MAARRSISSGARFAGDMGHRRAVVDGDRVFVSGTTGFDDTTGVISEDVVVQCGQTRHNVTSALAQAGFTLGDAVRVRSILPRAEDVEPCWPLLRARLGAAPPPPP